MTPAFALRVCSLREDVCSLGDRLLFVKRGHDAKGVRDASIIQFRAFHAKASPHCYAARFRSVPRFEDYCHGQSSGPAQEQ